MSYMSPQIKNKLYSIISEYTSDGSKISLEELSELSGVAKTTIYNNMKSLDEAFSNLKRSKNPIHFWTDNSDTSSSVPEKVSVLDRIINFIEEHSANGEKVSSSDILEGLGISRHTFWNVSGRIAEANPKIKSDGGYGKTEKHYWIEKEEEKPMGNDEMDPEERKTLEAIMNSFQITENDVPMDVGEIWTDKSGYDAKGFDRRKYVIVAIAGHTAYALEVRTTEDGFNKNMGDIWVGRSGIGYLAPRLIFQKSTSSFDQYTGCCPADVMEKIRARLTALFGIKPQVVEKIVEKEVPVEVEKIVEKTVEVPVPSKGDISEVEIALLRQKVEIYENLINAYLRKEAV